MACVIRALNFFEPAVTEDAKEKIQTLDFYSTSGPFKTDFVEHTSVRARTSAIFAVAVPVIIRALSSVMNWEGFISQAQLMKGLGLVQMRTGKAADAARTLAFVASFPRPITLGCLLATGTAWITNRWQNWKAEDGVRELFVERFMEEENSVPLGVMQYFMLNPKGIECLIEKKVKLQEKMDRGDNLLTYVLNHNRENAKRNETLSLLVEKGGMTISTAQFCGLVRLGRLDLIKQILEKKYVNTGDFSAEEQRNIWAKVNDRRIAWLLIEHGFKIDSVPEGETDTALIVKLKELTTATAVREPFIYDEVLLLLEHGAAVPTGQDQPKLSQALEQARTAHTKENFPLPKPIKKQPNPFQIFKPLVNVDSEKEAFGKGNIAARTTGFAIAIFVALGVTCLSLRKTGGVVALGSLAVSLILSVPYHKWEHKRATERLEQLAMKGLGKPFPLSCVMDYIAKEKLQQVNQECQGRSLLDRIGKTTSGV